MLPRNRRLSDDKTIEKTKLSGKVCSGKVASFIVDREEKDSDTKFCVVVSTKVSKKAVERNSVKRKVNLYIEKNLTRFKKGFNIVIIIKRSMLSKGQEDIEKELSELSESAKVIK